MASFSNFEVPVGNVPSTGSALTGSRSPSPASRRDVNRVTKSGIATGSRTGAVPTTARLDPRESLERQVDRGEVALDDRLAALPVGLLDERLDPRDRLVGRHDAREPEEARLHDRVDPAAGPGLGRDGERVDHPQLDRLVDDRRLHVRRQVLPHLVRAVRGVQQERRPALRVLEDPDPFEQPELVAGDEVGVIHEVGGADRLRPEAEVGDRDRARLARVIDEVALGEQPGALADDLDRRLVRTHGAVRAEAVEQRRDLAGRASDPERAGRSAG